MKFKSLIIVVLLVAFSYGGVYAYNTTQPAKQMLGYAKTEGFETVSEMEGASTLIIVGKKIAEETPVLIEGGDYGGYTIAEFKVSKVLKNTTGDTIKEGNTVSILENAVDYTNLLGKKVKISDNGYQLMKKESKYILFLDESGSDPGVYIPKGVTYGKVPLDTAKEDIELSKMGNKVDGNAKSVILQAKEKYKNEK